MSAVVICQLERAVVDKDAAWVQLRTGPQLRTPPAHTNVCVYSYLGDAWEYHTQPHERNGSRRALFRYCPVSRRCVTVHICQVAVSSMSVQGMSWMWV